MKIKYLIICFLIVCICLSCSQTKRIFSINRNASEDVIYKIKEIYTRDLFDIIYAQKNDSLFKIISLKDTIMPNLPSLEVGKKYKLDLIQIYPDFNNEKTKLGATDSCLIGIEKRSYWSLYSATNLNGSFLLDTSKGIEEVISKFSIYAILGDAVHKNKNGSLIIVYFK